MKKTKTILVIILLVTMTGCGGKQSNDDLIIVNVTKSYPEKELILQDFMDVDYIALETNDEFITTGDVMDIGKEFILVRTVTRNRNGDILIFDRTGKGASKFNRQGQGPGEYASISKVFLDEDNKEIFIDEFQRKSIKVYDFSGNFTREFHYKENALYYRMLNYDRESFICWNETNLASQVYKDEASKTPFFIVSKQDGSIIEEIKIPFEEIISYTDIIINRDNQGKIQSVFAINPDNALSIINSQGQWILAESSVDTIYRYLPDHTMIPFMTRTPSIRSMDPKVFLLPGIITDRYYFMQIFKKEFDLANQRQVPEVDLLYDRESKALFEYAMYNDDYTDKRHVVMMGKSRCENDEIVFWQKLEAFELVEAYKEGKLKGKLKKVAATLDEEDNPVIMIVKHKR